MVIVCAAAMLLSYIVFVFNAERLSPYPAPRGAVAHRRWRRAVWLAPAVGFAAVTVGAWVVLPAPLSWIVAAISATSALGLLYGGRRRRTRGKDSPTSVDDSKARVDATPTAVVSVLLEPRNVVPAKRSNDMRTVSANAVGAGSGPRRLRRRTAVGARPAVAENLNAPAVEEQP